MILVLSPSKTLDFETPPQLTVHTQPQFLKESELLMKELRKYTPAKLSKLMDISAKLSALNVQRNKDFTTPFTLKNSKQAILAFTGDVYDGVNVSTYTKSDFEFAQQHVRILSGLYGLLRPLDLIQPYRLEMGTKLKNPRGKDLYGFWDSRITDAINASLKGQKKPLLINLASEEYFAAVQPKKLQAGLISPVFKENHKGKLQVIGLMAKKARGLMASYIVKQRIEDTNKLKNFKENGYSFESTLSDEQHLVFVRG